MFLSHSWMKVTLPPIECYALNIAKHNMSGYQYDYYVLHELAVGKQHASIVPQMHEYHSSLFSRILSLE